MGNVLRPPLAAPLGSPLKGPFDSGAVEAADPVLWSETDKNAGITLSNANATATKTSGSLVGVGAVGDTAKSSGKWYAEFTVASAAGSFSGCGITPVSSSRVAFIGAQADCYGYLLNGGKYFDTVYFGIQYSNYTSGDVIGVAVDIDGNTIEFFKNNVTQGQESVTLNAASYVLAMSSDTANVAYTIVADMNYAPPAGFSKWTG